MHSSARTGMPPPLEKVDEAAPADFSPRPFQPSSQPSGLAQMDSVLSSIPSSLTGELYSRPTSLDCTDRSVNLWETLLPLQSTSTGQALDVIAP